MKKVIFGTALASMALLSACSSDNELANVGTTANNAIGFHVVGNKAETRANIIDTSEKIKNTDFNVFAFTRNEDGSDGAIFMGDKTDNVFGKKGIKINHTKGDWDYADPADLHYWPQDTHLNFYAVNPATVEGDMQQTYNWSIEKDAKTISYTSADEYGGSEVNYDVMYGITKDQTQASNNGKVKFQFKHILSQVVFKAKTALANMEVNIKEIKIHNFRLGGVFTLPTADATEGTWKLNAPAIPSMKWGTFTVVKDQNIDVTNTGADISVNTPMLFVPQELSNPWQTKATTPKTKADADADHESYLEITCKITQEGEYLFGSKDAYKTLYVPFGTTWEIGKCHIYTLIFGGGYNDQGEAILKPINFEAETTKWVEDSKNNNNGNDINIDK